MLSSNLKNLRKEKGVSLQVVATSAGISKPHIWSLETGKNTNPSLDILLKLSEFYDIGIDELVGNIVYQPARLELVKAFVLSDSIAITHQSTGQYRRSILKLCS